MKLVIVSGLSGSGKSVALHTLEDLGHYCIDNLPVFLLKDLAAGLSKTSDAFFANTAVGIDARNKVNDLKGLPDLIKASRTKGIDCRMVFLEADNETLIKRFSETRRKHPCTRSDRPLAEALLVERTLLEPIRRVADLRINTTHTNVHELRDMVRERMGGDSSPKTSILVQSFGFKHGMPQDVDFVFDIRCLPNPHWEAALRPLTGLDRQVVHFLENSPEVVRMRDDILAFFERWIPAFESDGRSYLTIAVGCTGGQHRSVYMAESLRHRFEKNGHEVMVRHRELP